MKITKYLAVCVVSLMGCSSGVFDKSPEPFVIRGDIDGKHYGTVSIGLWKNGEFVPVQTTEFIDGVFTMSGELRYPELYLFQVQGIDGFKTLFIDPDSISLHIVIDSNNIEAFEIEGSVSSDLYQEYLSGYKEFSNQSHSIYETYYKPGKENKDEALLAKADSLFDLNDQAKKAYIVNFASENKQSAVSPYIIFRNFYYFDLAELDSVASLFDASIAQSEYMIKLTERVDILKRVDINQPLVDFAMNDTAGQPVVLSSLTGKNYLLVDFWASWCRPCRVENPNIVAIYNDYHNKGFDVLGVSLDSKKESWTKAIHDDSLTWHHVSDLVRWQNAAAKLYGVRSIPQNILLDPDGIIIAKNLRGEDLRNKVSALLD